MLNLSGYDLGEQLHHSERTLVFRAARKDGRQVAIKAPANPQPSELELARFGAEYQIGREIVHQGIVRVLGLEQAGHRPALVLEDFGGQSLAETLAEGPLELEAFYDLAIQLAEAIGELHHRGVTHKDINPANIIHNPRTGQIKLTDLSIATVLKREDLRTVDPHVLEGTLRYMSPEQTGRMNRSIDYRTDFYSLGVTLYEMLVGRVPFDAEDPLELVHAHIARTPTAPSQVNPRVPAALSEVVMKLLAKTADDRYQSAAGLLADLRRCRQLGAEDSFRPGEQDTTALFSIPEKLYGRQRELDRMTAILDQAAEGSRQLMLITGGSGIGKSSLVDELQRPVVQRRGWFISGKFDPLRRDIPHSAFIDAADRYRGSPRGLAAAPPGSPGERGASAHRRCTRDGAGARSPDRIPGHVHGRRGAALQPARSSVLPCYLDRTRAPGDLSG
jgi:serine/threonine protein kinase